MSRPHDNREIFGTDPDGRSVYRVMLTGGGLTAHVLTWGGILQDLRLARHEPPLVLGFHEFQHYLDHSPYFGATPGRFANRIGGASFELNGKTYQLDANFLDKHTLHGGGQGTGKRNWTIADLGTSHVDLTLTDPDGWMGFPGTVELTCSYTLKDDSTLQVAFSARTDTATPVSLAHHSYFNLDGSADCRDHTVQIDAETYLPVDDELIPVGAPASVDGTAFDFRIAKRIGADLEDGLIYDHNWCLASERHNQRHVATATGGDGLVTMEVHTTEPGLQFYAGHKVDTPVEGLSGETYGAYAGFCFETQVWPDAPNQPDYPNSILQPDETIRQVTQYKFMLNR
ncbi:MAG: aldose epimerase family protein [Pseudomonadota bacterium]